MVDAKGRIRQTTNYYAFGMTSEESSSTWQSYKYNGKELDRMHGLDTYDYGARQYDPVLARWDRIDPLCEKYYSTSPYAYCVNNPVNAIDPDGNLTVFINGFMPYPWESEKGYWGNRVYDFLDAFNEYTTTPRFYDGSIGAYASLFVDANAKPSPWYFCSLNIHARFRAGLQQGTLDAKSILEDLKQDGNMTLRIVTHSMGGAYGKGFATAIMNYYKKHKKQYEGLQIIEYDLAPYNADQQNAVDGVTTWQIHDINDGVADCTPIFGTYFLPVNSGKNGLDSHSKDNDALWDMLLNLAPGKYHVVEGQFVKE